MTGPPKATLNIPLSLSLASCHLLLFTHLLKLHCWKREIDRAEESVSAVATEQLWQ